MEKIIEDFSQDIFKLFESKYKSENEDNNLSQLATALVISLRKIKITIIKKESWNDFDKIINDYLKDECCIDCDEG